MSRLRDLIDDVTLELRARLSRTILMIAAVALSTGALLASIGISATSARQLDADLAASTLTYIEVAASDDSGNFTLRTDVDPASQTTISYIYPADTVERVRALTNVVDAGMRLDLDSRARVRRDVVSTSTELAKVTGVTSGYLKVRGVTTSSSATGLLDTNQPIFFADRATLTTLGMPPAIDSGGYSITISGVNYSYAGELRGDTSLAGRVVIPYVRAVNINSSDRQAILAVRTAIGAGPQVVTALVPTLRPDMPSALSASPVAATTTVRNSVANQLATQAAWVGAFLIVLTILLITNSMIVSVTARTTEIGVRRALGASRMGVAGVFWWEGGIIGLLGGTIGSAVSSVMTLVVAIVSGWSATMSILWVLLGPVIGAVVGLVASAYPALRASRIQPAIAVRAN